MNSEDAFFISDIHFFHVRILEYDRRPFQSLEEMHNAIIVNWNDKVPKTGTVLLLGDVALGGSARAEAVSEILNSLNGKIILVSGNHDTYVLKKPCVDRFESIHKRLGIDVADGDKTQRIEMCHYPPNEEYTAEPDSWLLHGHTHHNNHHGEKPNKHPYQLDVGINGAGYNYSPLSYLDVKRLILNGK